MEASPAPDPHRPTTPRRPLRLRPRIRRRILARRLGAILAAAVVAAATHLLLNHGRPEPGTGTSTEGGVAGPSSTSPGSAQTPDPTPPTTAGGGLGPGERAVSINLPPGGLPLTVGDRVELVGVVATTDGAEARVLSGPIQVLALAPGAVVVGLPAHHHLEVIEQQATGAVVVVAVDVSLDPDDHDSPG